MTYVPTWAGFIYLAVVMDVFSRKVVGWAFGERMTSNLVIAALNMALVTRRPETVIHRSDQYTSVAFGKRCQEMGVKPSMGTMGDAIGTVGDAYDNGLSTTCTTPRVQSEGVSVVGVDDLKVTVMKTFTKTIN